jgi:hypothetical protein
MTRRSFRFCQDPIEWNYFLVDQVDHTAADRTLSFRPRSTLICFVDGFLAMLRIRVALLHSRVTRFTQRPLVGWFIGPNAPGPLDLPT